MNSIERQPGLKYFWFFLPSNAGWNSPSCQARVTCSQVLLAQPCMCLSMLVTWPWWHNAHHHGACTALPGCLSLCVPVFVLGRGHLGSFSNKWHSVAILLQVTQPLDFIYHTCWLPGRHGLQIVPGIICALGTIYLYNQIVEISYSRSRSSSLEFILGIFTQLNQIAEISLTTWYLLIFAYISKRKVL